jgi:RNA 2',3'-cyclic 3'-phosphodiesterase
MMMRLFIGIALPKNIKDMIFLLKDERLTGANWTNSEQWHITLHFIGETEAEPSIREILETVEAESFTIKLKGTGVFPAKGKPTTLWAGIEAPEALNKLHSAIATSLKTIDVKPESKPFNPHLTLARFKEKVPSQEIMENYRLQYLDFESPEFRVDSFVLYRSDLQRSGAIYTIRQRYPLLAL